MTCRPDHAPRHPDFEEGNTFSLVHGGDSPRAIAARAEQIHAELLAHAPYLNEPRFLPAVSRYLQAAAREALLHDHHHQRIKGAGGSEQPALGAGNRSRTSERQVGQ